MELKTIILLGVGGPHGSEYKLDVIRKVSPFASRLLVVEYDDHWAREIICQNRNCSFVSLPSGLSLAEEVAALAAEFDALTILPDVILTYRQEWLEIKAALSARFGVNGPTEAAIRLSRNKTATKQMLRDIGLPVPAFITLRPDRFQNSALPPFPIFIRPMIGIRSEWARAIGSEEELVKYMDDIKSSHELSQSEFLIESLLKGHEIDIDLFLHQGKVLYAKTSDNLPTRFPYALETGHLMPSVLSAEVQKTAINVASKAVLESGLRDGNMHVELMVLPDGTPYLLEINARLGGMYIAQWHERVWGVNLILAELAVQSGRSPDEFLVEKPPTLALAQICLSASIPTAESSQQRQVSLILGDTTRLPPEITLENWYPEPQAENLEMSGPLNLGAVTAVGKDPLAAFRRLDHASITSAVSVDENGQKKEPFLQPLVRFCSNSSVERYAIRPFVSADAKGLAELLRHLSPRANFDYSAMLPPDSSSGTTIFCMEDTFAGEGEIVGTIAVHLWDRMRPGNSKCAYLHDLVVLPRYRGTGLGAMLVDAAVAHAEKSQCYKIHLDCDETLEEFYSCKLFEAVASCMVRYV